MCIVTSKTGKDSAEECDNIEAVIIRNSSFFNLNDKKFICRIKNKKLFSSTKVILDAQGKIKYYTDIVLNKNYDNNKNVCEKYAIFNDEMKIATAYIVKDNSVKKSQRLISIPKITTLFIDFPSYGTYIINRLQNNNFIIKNDKNIISKISPFSLIKHQKMIIFNHQDVYLMATFYCLVQSIIQDEFILLI